MDTFGLEKLNFKNANFHLPNRARFSYRKANVEKLSRRVGLENWKLYEDVAFEVNSFHKKKGATKTRNDIFKSFSLSQACSDNFVQTLL